MSLCVNPIDAGKLPRADRLAVLVLVLQTDPDLFFREANYAHERDGRWRNGPVPIT